MIQGVKYMYMYVNDTNLTLRTTYLLTYTLIIFLNRPFYNRKRKHWRCDDKTRGRLDCLAFLLSHFDVVCYCQIFKMFNNVEVNYKF